MQPECSLCVTWHRVRCKASTKMDGVFAIPRFRRARTKCAWGTRSNALLMSKLSRAPPKTGARVLPAFLSRTSMRALQILLRCAQKRAAPLIAQAGRCFMLLAGFHTNCCCSYLCASHAVSCVFTQMSTGASLAVQVSSLSVSVVKSGACKSSSGVPAVCKRAWA